MNITEVSNLTGLKIKNIKFYKKRGIINENSNSKSNEEFLEDDIRILKEVKLFRKLNISIDDIKSIEKGIATIDFSLERYSNYLGEKISKMKNEEKVKDLSKIKDIYDRIRNDIEFTKDFNVDIYLQEISYLEEQGYEFNNIENDYINKGKGFIKTENIWFEPNEPIMNSRDFTDEILKFGIREKKDITILHEGMEPVVLMDGIKYVAMLETPRTIDFKGSVFFMTRTLGFRFVYFHRYE